MIKWFSIDRTIRPNYRKIVASVLILAGFVWLAFFNPFVDNHKLHTQNAEIESEQKNPQQILSNNIKAKLPDNNRVNIKSRGDLCFAEILDESGALEGIYFETDGLSSVKGYNGPLTLGVWTRVDGVINAVDLVRSKDTKAYVKRINRSGYYSQYTGMSLKSPHNRVDALSGATITTVAVARTLEGSVGKASDLFLEEYIPGCGQFRVKAGLNKWWYLHLAGIALLIILSWPGLLRNGKWLRRTLYILSVGYLGFYMNSAFSYVVFLQPFWGTLLSKIVAIYSLMVLLGAIWGKNVYCRMVCPFGNLQRLIGAISPLKPGKIPLSGKNIERVRQLVSLILIGGVIVGMRGWSGYELFPDLFGLHTDNLWFWVAVVIVLASAKFPNLWCRTTCPTGCLLDNIDKIVSRSHKKSTQNHKC